MGTWCAILISGGIAAFIAVWAVCSNRAIARKRATLDLIRSSELDSYIVDARRKFIAATQSKTGAKQYASQRTSDEFYGIMTVLNEYELVSIGIQRGILDDELYRQWFRQGAIDTWDYTQSFVIERRKNTGRPELWVQFETLVECYKKNKRFPGWWRGL